MDATDFDGGSPETGIVLTGEGRVDDRPPSARPRSESPGAPRAAGVRCVAVGGGADTGRD